VWIFPSNRREARLAITIIGMKIYFGQLKSLHFQIVACDCSYVHFRQIGATTIYGHEKSGAIADPAFLKKFLRLLTTTLQVFRPILFTFCSGVELHAQV
jgi:hypothetical protein